MTGDITCRHVVEIVTDYFEGALDPRERVRLEQHVSLCQGCSAYVDQMRLAIDVTRALGADELRLQTRDPLLERLLQRPGGDA
ncbi:MAG: anti-sigma factor family protein [Solirubrobacteraceae bacterium]